MLTWIHTHAETEHTHTAGSDKSEKVLTSNVQIRSEDE